MYFLKDLILFGFQLLSVYPEPGCDRKAAVFKGVLLQNLVLTDSRRNQIAAGIGEFEHFKEALNGSVFSVCAVHDRNRDIDGSEFLFSEQTGMNRMNDDLVVLLDQIDLCAFLQKRRDIPVVLHIKKQVGAVQLALLGYIDRNYIVFFVIKGVDRLMRGNYRYFVLYGFTAEEHRNVEFHCVTSSNMPYYNAAP